MKRSEFLRKKREYNKFKNELDRQTLGGNQEPFPLPYFGRDVMMRQTKRGLFEIVGKVK